jgi:hypothetical protein
MCRLSRPRLRFATAAGLLAVTILAGIDAAPAAAPRVLPDGKLPNDARLAPPKDLNGYFPLAVPKSADEWAQRTERIRRQILVSQGLWPLPERTPLHPAVHGLIDQGDYTVEKVFFESVPGFYVTGNLYRPKNKSGKVPGVLFPHGHWNDGRFIDIGRTAVRKEIVIGSERFENGGRSLLQSLPVQVARMGCIAFHYDMIGYADSTQLSYQLAHRFDKQRPEMNTTENWGLFSPQAEAHLQSIMGLQTWNSIRALDFLLSLPDVDASRIAVTGASGGGTQTMLLAGIDPRVTLSFPAVMVSTAMQGGCTCENACCLRVETSNVEFAALFATKPLGMTAANDWTKEMATKGFPELQGLYRLLGASKNVELFAFTHFPHNYNYVSRASFYGFLNRHFKLGLEEPVVEEDYQRLTREELTVWDVAHPRPEGGAEFERKLCRYLHEEAQRQLAAIQPKDTASLTKWREVAGGAAEVILGRGLPTASDLEFEKSHETDGGSYTRFAGALRNKPRGEELPLVSLHPKNWNGRAVIWLGEQGKSALFADDGSPGADAKRLLDAGILIVGVDLLFQGEFLSQEAPMERNRTVKNTREFAGYTYGYNYSLLAQRAHDVLSVVSFVRHHPHTPKSVELIALDGAAPIAAVALAQCGGAVDRAALDTRGFRFGKLTDYLDVNFLPGGAKYGDLPGFLALAAPTKLWVAGETTESAALAKMAYVASGVGSGVNFADAKSENTASRALEWILKGP